MATLLAFHAHPDDESIGMGGTLAKASAEGHRVVLVLATRGELGEVPDGLLEPGENLGSADRARLEARSDDPLGDHLGQHRSQRGVHRFRYSHEVPEG